MGTEAPGRFEEVAPAGERGFGEQLRRPHVGDGRPLELDEQQLGGDRRGALLDGLEQRAAGGVGGVGGEPQVGEGARPVDALVDRLELVGRGGELGRGERTDATVKACAERLGVVEGRREVVGKRRVVR